MEFYRTYQNYTEGFGDPSGEFWIGKNLTWRLFTCMSKVIGGGIYVMGYRSGCFMSGRVCLTQYSVLILSFSYFMVLKSWPKFPQNELKTSHLSKL